MFEGDTSAVSSVITERKISNLPASIQQRLLQVAQASNRPFQEVLQYYAMERFLFRLSVSPHVEKFILKGALMLTAWGAPATRPTRDIDLLGYVPHQVESLVEIIREVCRQEVEPDALSFDPTTATGILMTKTACQERKRVERKPRCAMHFENCLLSLPSMQFHPRSLDFSGGTAHTAGNA